MEKHSQTLNEIFIPGMYDGTIAAYTRDIWKATSTNTDERSVGNGWVGAVWLYTDKGYWLDLC